MGTLSNMGNSRDMAHYFRDRVREGRKALQWSQADLAKHLSERGIGVVHPSVIGKIEAGERSVRVDEAAAIADLFNVSVDSLLGRRIDEDAERDYALRSITSSAQRAADQVRDILEATERARDGIAGLDDFPGRRVLQADIKRALQKLEAAQGALTTMARFERGSTPAPTQEDLGR